MTRALLVLLLLGTLFLLSWLALPIRRVEVAGSQSLPPEAIARLAGLYAGGPWLYAPLSAARRVAAHPRIAEVRLSRPELGVVRIEVRERRPYVFWQGPLGFPGARPNGVVLDDGGHPLLATRAPRTIQGPDPELEKALALARRYPDAREITFGPAGYTLDFGKRRAWLARADLAAGNPPRGHVYAWGVSEGP